jgi:dolichyl-phosphate-mannose-protein mannosyltransferase
MSVAEINSAKDKALPSTAAHPISAIRAGGIVVSSQKAALIAMAVMIIIGAGLRLKGLGAVGFAEDEINKVEAARAYDRGDFTANAEHPMLMKLLIDVSLRGARAWNSMTTSAVSEEAALRFPNALFGALTAIPLCLLTAALFDLSTGLWAAALWSFGVTAITFNRVGKEDTLMVFFMLFAFYLFIQAKIADRSKNKLVNRLRNLSGVSFGLMMASKYFPHYLGLNMLYHHNYSMRPRKEGEARWKTPLSFFLLMGLAFVLANPAILSPKVWAYLNAYSGEKLLTHTGYLMGDRLYKNNISRSPFWATPLYFYLLWLAIKVPLAVLVTCLIGFVTGLRRWREPGHGFVIFMILFWIVPYSLMGAKWPRYLLSLMPFVYMSAAVGIVLLIRWTTSAFAKWNSRGWVSGAVTGVLLFATVVMPAFSAYASAPHYGLYSNVIGDRYTAYFFPHDEFYDDGLNEAIRFVCANAPPNGTIVTETPGVVRYYTEKFGRKDLQSQVLSDPNFSVPSEGALYFVLQRGRTYFENRDKMKQVREHFPMVYASCVRDFTAAEVYSAQAGAVPASQRCAHPQ